jgi:hypothetical protein
MEDTLNGGLCPQAKFITDAKAEKTKPDNEVNPEERMEPIRCEISRHKDKTEKCE